VIVLPHSDNPAPVDLNSTWRKCERCGAPYDVSTSAWDLCPKHLERELENMTPKELADVPGAVLRLVDPNLKEEYFRE
jgi:hypothetical protein